VGTSLEQYHSQLPEGSVDAFAKLSPERLGNRCAKQASFASHPWPSPLLFGMLGRGCKLTAAGNRGPKSIEPEPVKDSGATLSMRCPQSRPPRGFETPLDGNLVLIFGE
jgi:hypothetical protein